MQDHDAPPEVGRGARVVVRRFRAADLPAFLRYQDDPVVRRHQRGAALDAAAARAFVDRQSTLPLGERGAWHAFAVELRDDGVVVGDVGIWVPADPGRAEGDVGFQFDPRVHGRGLAREAVEVFLPYAFGAFGLERVTASCDARNTASWRLLERVGFDLLREADGERHYGLAR